MDHKYMQLAHNLAAQSHCLKRKVGAVLVSADKANIITAVNNPLPDPNICKELGCLRQLNHIPSGTHNELCRCIHCETSLIAQCAQKGISTSGATVYTTLYPCLSCAKILVAAGITRLVYDSPYPDKYGKQYLENSSISITHFTSDDIAF